MINYVEEGFQRRVIRQQRVIAVIGAIGLAGLGLLMWGLSWQVDKIDRYLSERLPATDTVMVGLKKATLENGDVVMRIGIVEEPPKAEARGEKLEARVAERKGR